MIPNDVIAHIISQADFSIDTYLSFKYIGAIPKKLPKLDNNFKKQLDQQFIFRRCYYHLFKLSINYPLYSISYKNNIKATILVIDDIIILNIEYIEIMYSVDINNNNNIKYDFVVRNQHGLIRHQEYDI